jgi:hypothetical protein
MRIKNKKHYFEFTITGNQTSGGAAVESFLFRLLSYLDDNNLSRLV